MKKIKNLYKKYEEIINYLIIGVLTTLISLGVYYICTITILDPKIFWKLQCANVLSWIISVTFAYITNRIIVFKSKNPHIIKEGIKFYGARVLTLVLDMLFTFITITLMGLNDKIMKIISTVIVQLANYVISKLFIFINKSEKDEKR